MYRGEEASDPGKPERSTVGTSHVERYNVRIRMGMRRFIQPTVAFGKKIDNHLHMPSLSETMTTGVGSSRRKTPESRKSMEATVADDGPRTGQPQAAEFVSGKSRHHPTRCALLRTVIGVLTLALAVAARPSAASEIEHLDDLADAQPSLQSLIQGDRAGGFASLAGFALDGMLFGVAGYRTDRLAGGALVEYFDGGLFEGDTSGGDLLGGAWGAAKLSDSGYVELRAIGGDDDLWTTQLLVELDIPLPPYLLLTPFVVGTYAAENGVDFRRGEAGARLGTRTEGPVSFAGIATTGPVGFQAGLGGIDSDAYDPRLRATVGAGLPFGSVRLGIGARYTTGVDELGVGGSLSFSF